MAIPAPVDLEQATVRELVIELALVQYALRQGPSPTDLAALDQAEREAVDELRSRDLPVSCHRQVSRPVH